MISRRKFLNDCAKVAAVTSLVPAGIPVSAPLPAAAAPSLAGFQSHVGNLFSVATRGGTCLRLRLIEAAPLPPQGKQAHLAPDADFEKFSLIFEGPAHDRLPQDSYEFQAPGRLAPMSIFIVPVPHKGAMGPYYQAIFNRPKTAAGA